MTRISGAILNNPHKIAIRKFSLGLLVALVGALLSSCNTTSFLSGASSMRIDVDVYKGPLANGVAVQKGQLETVVNAAKMALNDVDGQLVTSMCRLPICVLVACKRYFFFF